MIGKLRGKVDSVGEGFLILDVNGVGYEVWCSSRTLRVLHAGEETSLAIETHVREDQIRLFGFANEADRSWFRLLQSVQGVGAKVALGLLGTFAPQDLANAIALQDKAMVGRAPGVGPKLAQRIVVELKDKAPALTAAGVSLPQMVKGGKGADAEESTAAADAISALVNLGYQQSQAATAVAAAMKKASEGAGAKELIRLGLKEMAR